MYNNRDVIDELDTSGVGINLFNILYIGVSADLVIQMFPPNVPNTGNLFLSLTEDNESQDPLSKRTDNEHESEEYLLGLLAHRSEEVHNNVNYTVNERVETHEVGFTSMEGRYRPTNEIGRSSRLTNGAPNGTNDKDRLAKCKRKSRGINKQNFAVDHPEKV